MADEKNAVKRLKEKIEAGYKEKYAYWMKQSPEWLVEMADEIVAVQQMREELADYVSEEDAEYLLRFKDPLEVVSDYWVGTSGLHGNIGDSLSHTLWELRDKRDAEQDYELEPTSPNPQTSQQMLM